MPKITKPRVKKSILKKSTSKLSSKKKRITFNFKDDEDSLQQTETNNKSFQDKLNQSSSDEENDSDYDESPSIPPVLQAKSHHQELVDGDDLYDLDPVDEETEESSKSLISAVKKATGIDKDKNAIITEFGDPSLFVTSTAAGKITARDLISTMQQIKGKDAKTVASQKLLKKLSRKSSLAVPLETPVANLAARIANYEDVVKILTRKWDHLVKSNRIADQLVFPLSEPISSTSVRDEAPIRSTPTHMNEMEAKINELLNSSKNHLKDDKELTPAEEELIKSLSVEEAKARHAELQRMRALLSYQQAKLVRQAKIKSKQYRRILKKEKLRNVVKDFEELKEKNPSAALEQLESWDKQRALERASLRHKNTGKFAKIAKLRSKYNDSIRDALEEKSQLAQQLLQRRQFSDDEDEAEEDEDETEEKISSHNENDKNNPRQNGSNETFIEESFDVAADYNPWLKSIAETAVKEKKKQQEESAKNKGKVQTKVLDLSSFVPDDEDDVDEEEEIQDEDDEQEESLDRQDKKSINKKGKKNDVNTDSSTDDHKGPPRKRQRSEVEQMQLITEAFASDDVVADFTKEKEKELEKKLDTICPSDGHLPGWGNWAGIDEDPIEAKRRKRREAKEKRQRKRLERIARKEPLFKSNVIINPKANNCISTFKVKSVPYPFVSVKDYEGAVLAQPLGRTFVPESSFRTLNAPRIVTKMGSIIKPMSEEIAPKKPVATVKRKKSTKYKNEKRNEETNDTIEPPVNPANGQNDGGDENSSLLYTTTSTDTKDEEKVKQSKKRNKIKQRKQITNNNSGGDVLPTPVST